MRQTNDGYIWLTTLDGLVRFDGVRFTVFNKSNSKNLPGNRFINLLAEEDDTLWISTEEQGLIRRGRDGEFRTFTAADGLPSNFVYAVQKMPDGVIVAYTDSGTARFDGERFIAAPDDDFHQFKRLLAPSGAFWEFDKNSLRLIKNGREIFYELPANLKELFNPKYDFVVLINLFEDERGALWITADNATNENSSGKLFKFVDGEFEEIRAENMPPSLVYDMAQDRRGDLWLATQSNGACRLRSSSDENRFDCFAAKDGLADALWRIFKDREDVLWASTDNRGFFRFTERAVAPVSAAQNLVATNVYAVLQTVAGAIWIGSHGGLAKYENGRMKNYSRADGLIYTDVQSLFEDENGRLWIGSLDGIEYLENGEFYDFSDVLQINKNVVGFYDIHRDRENALWFATNAGLVRYDETRKETRIYTTADGLPSDNVRVILENSNGSFWIGTYGGIALFEAGKFTRYTEAEGLAGNNVRALYLDAGGALWIGTYESGLSRFENGKFTNYRIENGLASNGAFQILEDAGGNFWISSNQGIHRTNRRQLEAFAAGEIQFVNSTLFGKSDGMLNSEANGGGQPAGIKTDDGRLWFPTQDGVAVINPEAVETNPLPPPVVIEKIRIDNREHSALSVQHSAIEISPGEENLEIDYTGLSFIKPEQIRFRYKLEGLDENWIEAGTRRTAFYPYLPPGKYTFHVAAANSDGVWNERGASVAFNVLPPFYRTWWFFAGSFVVVGLAVFAVYRRRVFQLERARHAQEDFSRRLMNAHESERRRIAAELHDSVGQSLAMIKNRVVFNQMKIGDEAMKEQLELIAAQTAQTISEVREISYNLRPYLLERLGLTEAIKSLLDDLSDTGEIKTETEIDDLDEFFDPEREMILYRIVQESLSNVVKHAAARTVNVLIKKDDTNLKIVIRDDGVGFNTEAATRERTDKGGFGLIGIGERVRMLGGRYSIESAPGAGTTISIVVNLEKNG